MKNVEKERRLNSSALRKDPKMPNRELRRKKALKKKNNIYIYIYIYNSPALRKGLKHPELRRKAFDFVCFARGPQNAQLPNMELRRRRLNSLKEGEFVCSAIWSFEEQRLCERPLARAQQLGNFEEERRLKRLKSSALRKAQRCPIKMPDREP